MKKLFVAFSQGNIQILKVKLRSQNNVEIFHIMSVEQRGESLGLEVSAPYAFISG